VGRELPAAWRELAGRRDVVELLQRGRERAGRLEALVEEPLGAELGKVLEAELARERGVARPADAILDERLAPLLAVVLLLIPHDRQRVRGAAPGGTAHDERGREHREERDERGVHRRRGTADGAPDVVERRSHDAGLRGRGTIR
jgi:hypothetical protein